MREKPVTRAINTKIKNKRVLGYEEDMESDGWNCSVFCWVDPQENIHKAKITHEQSSANKELEMWLFPCV